MPVNKIGCLGILVQIKTSIVKISGDISYLGKCLVAAATVLGFAFVIGSCMFGRELNKIWQVQVSPQGDEVSLVSIEPGWEFRSRRRASGEFEIEEPTITLGKRGLGVRGRVVPLEGGDLKDLWVKAVLVDRGVTFKEFSMLDQRTESWRVDFDLKRNLIPGERLTLKATLLDDDDREIREFKRGISIESRGAPP